MNARRGAVCLYGGSALVLLGFLLFSGVAPVPSTRILAVVAAQVAAGAYAWRVLQQRRSPSAVEALGMGTALGTSSAMLCGVLAFNVPIGATARAWAWAVPAVVVLVTWVVRRLRGHRLESGGALPPSQLVALSLGGLLGAVSLVVNLANYPLSWTGTWDRYHPDMLFFEALATSTARYGPTESILMAGADLRYHWFTYAWAGQVTEVSGADPFVTLTRVLPVVALLGTLAIAVGWSARLTRIPWVPTVAAVLLVSGGYVGATYGTILNFDSPSQSLTTVWLFGLCVILLAYLRRRSTWPRLVGIAVLVVAVAGGKISSAIAVGGAFALVVVVGFVRHQEWRFRAVQAFLVSSVAMASTYLLVLAGSSESGGLRIGQLLDKASSVQGLNPTNTSVGIMAGTVILVLAIAPRWAGLAWLVAAPRSRWRPATVLGTGLAVTAVLTVLFVSGGLNDTWFALAASAPLSVLSAVGVGRAVQAVAPSTGPWPRPIAWIAGLCGVLLAALVAALWSTGADGQLRWLGPLVGLSGAALTGVLLGRWRGLHGSRRARSLALAVVALVAMAAPSRLLGVGADEFGVMPETGLSTATFTPFVPFVESIDRTIVTGWSSDQAQAARWLAAHAGPSDIVATNVTFSPLVPALVGRRMLIADIMHQAPYGRPDALEDLLDRERDSWTFVTAPSAASAAPLCAADVRWVWVDPATSGVRDWRPFASIAYQAVDVVILQMDPSAC